MLNGVCQRVNRLPCDQGMKGCILYGRFVFSNPAKNRPAKPDVQNTAAGKAIDLVRWDEVEPKG